MTHFVQVARIFVASPSDTAGEREAVEEVCREFDRLHLGGGLLRYETVRWERDVVPGIGSDSQAVVNAQIGDNYDVLVVILWTRWGTATPRAGSGTEEEFDRALERHQAREGSVNFLVYFKDAPLPPSTINPQDLAKIGAFRDRLERLGIVYSRFSAVEEFKSQLRMHLAKIAKSLIEETKVAGDRASRRTESAEAQGLLVSKEPAREEDQPGFLDLLEMGSDAILEVTELVGELSESSQVLTRSVEEAAVQLSKPQVATGVQGAKGLFNRVAAQMDRYAERLEFSSPRLRALLGTAIQSYSKAVQLSVEVSGRESSASERLAESVRVLEGIADSIGSAIRGYKGMADQVEALPRLTTALSRSRRRLLAALGQLLMALEAGQADVGSALRVVSPDK